MKLKYYEIDTTKYNFAEEFENELSHFLKEILDKVNNDFHH